MIGINIIKLINQIWKVTNEDVISNGKKHVIRKVPISNIIAYFYFIFSCVLNVNLKHFFTVSLPLVFLFMCYTDATHDFYIMLCSCLVEEGSSVSSEYARDFKRLGVALFLVYNFSTIVVFCAFSVGNCTCLSFALRHLLTPFGIVSPFLFMEKTKINWKSLIVLRIFH